MSAAVLEFSKCENIEAITPENVYDPGTLSARFSVDVVPEEIVAMHKSRFSKAQ